MVAVCTIVPGLRAHGLGRPLGCACEACHYNFCDCYCCCCGYTATSLALRLFLLNCAAAIAVVSILHNRPKAVSSWVGQSPQLCMHWKGGGGHHTCPLVGYGYHMCDQIVAIAVEGGAAVAVSLLLWLLVLPLLLPLPLHCCY